jgi:ABC-2 type transport system ATP-binding protein
MSCTQTRDAELAIEARELTKSYGGVPAVRGVSFEVARGEVFCLLGPNGAGKTTIVEILEGYRTRSAGDARVLGIDPATGSRALREQVGIVLQECGVQNDLSVAELVEMYGRYHVTRRPVDEVIELVELTEKRDVRAKQLSGGQRRRLDLALALVGDPELIFLDEPTSGFDPVARRQAWSTIRSLCALGKTIFLTTHFMDEAQYLADRVAVMSAGQIIASGRPDELGGRDLRPAEIRFTVPAEWSLGDVPDAAGEQRSADGERILLLSRDPVRATQALREVRDAVSGYRRPTLDDELAGARIALSAAGITAEFDRPPVTLDPEVEAVLAWAAREGATNVIRHGGAHRCTVTVRAGLGDAAVEVLDDGASQPPGTGHRGRGHGGHGGRGGHGLGRAHRARRGPAWPAGGVLGLEPDFEVVAQMSRGDEVLRTALQARPDVALLDIEMPGATGLDAAEQLAEALPDCRVLILTTFGRPGYLRRAMEGGAAGFVLKDAPASQLASAIRRAMSGERVVDPGLAAAALSQGESPLTTREHEVLAAAREHATVAELATALYLSPGTLRNHLSS